MMYSWIVRASNLQTCFDMTEDSRSRRRDTISMSSVPYAFNVRNLVDPRIRPRKKAGLPRRARAYYATLTSRRRTAARVRGLTASSDAVFFGSAVQRDNTGPRKK